MKIIQLTLLSLAVALATGCVPTKRVQWTSDGKYAFVITPKDGLHMIDAEGKVLASKIEGEVLDAAWTHDGKHIIASRKIKVSDWKGLKPILTADQAAAIESAAAAERPRILEYSGDWKNYRFAENAGMSGGMQAALLAYLRDHDTGEIKEKLGEKWKEIESIDIPYAQLQVFDHSAGSLTQSRVIFGGLDDIAFLSVSPDDKFVAFNMKVWDRDGDDVALYVAASNGDANLRVADRAAIGAAWSPDGRKLAFVSPVGAVDKKNGDYELQLGSLATVEIRNGEGELMEKPSKNSDIAGLLFNPISSIHWMNDGRILFTSVEMNLPATRNELPRRWSLFAYDPKMPARIIQVLGRDFDAPLSSSVAMFEVSPDEQRVVLACDSGQAAVYEFATATTQLVPADGAPSPGVATVPTWRDDHSLCFARPVKNRNDDDYHSEIALWDGTKIKSLSENWPTEMRSDWLDK